MTIRIFTIPVGFEKLTKMPIMTEAMIIFAIEDLSTMKIIITDTTPYFTNEKQ